MRENNMENQKDYNNEIRIEVRKKFKNFQDFFNEIRSASILNRARSREIKNNIDLVTFLGDPLRNQFHMLEAYGDNIPAQVANDALDVVQKQMLKASAFYYGEGNLLDKDGNPLEKVEWLNK